MVVRKWTGSKWIRPEKRMAIYLRDGMACAYCGKTIEQGVMSLDHVKCATNGGSNSERNLITACIDCNDKRGTMDFVDFVMKHCPTVNRQPESVLLFVRSHLRMKLDIEQGRKVLAQRKMKDA